MYDVFILCLMAAGILAVVVFSYKIFHSRVYPVGMVREIPPRQEHPDLQGWRESKTELARYFTESMYFTESQSSSKWEISLPKTWVLKKSAVQPLELAEDQLVFYYELTDAVEERVKRREHALLKERVENLEKRLRRLETESLEKFQEATEQKAAPQVH